MSETPSASWRQWAEEKPAWTPPDNAMQATHLGKFLASHRLHSVQELREKAAKEPAWFWQSVEKSLEWPWLHPYSEVLSMPAGKPWPRWFRGGITNWALAVDHKGSSPELKDRPAVVAQSESGQVSTWTYSELLHDANRFARALQRQWDIRPGDTVGVMLPMIGPAAVALLGLAKLGAIAVPLFSGYGAEAVAQRLQDAGARYAIVADGVIRRGRLIPIQPVMDAAARRLPMLEHLIIVRYAGNDIVWNPGRDVWWHELDDASHSIAPITRPLAPDAPCLLLYTSGTTGQPKGTVHSHAGFPIKAAQDLAHAFDVGPGDVLCWMTDLGWMMGPWAIIGALVRGAAVVLYDGAPDYPDADRVWKLIDQHRVSVMGMAPTLVRGLMSQSAGSNSKALTSLRVLGSSGEPWDPESWHWLFTNIGQSRCPIINYSGGTEIGGGILGGTLLEPCYPCGFSGPIPGMDAEVVNERGEEVQDEVGDLVIRQPWPGMTNGFWKAPERYLAAYWQRWPELWTHGDWAVNTSHGPWFILGRADDTIKVAGKRVGPAEVEAVLMQDPSVLEAAVVGLPDPIKGEVLAGFVVLAEGESLSAERQTALAERVAASLGKPLKPAYVAALPSLPKTRNGKIMRRVVRAVTLGESAGDLSSLDNPESVASIPRLSGK